jgi:membrane protease YdiL (CAAX protease family)
MAPVRRRDALLALAVVLLATIVLPYMPDLLIPSAPQEVGVPAIDTSFIARKWCEAGLAAGLLAFFMFRHRLRPAAFGLRRDGLGGQALWGLGALAGIYAALLASAIILVPLYLLFPAAEGELQRRVEFVEAMPVDQIATTIVLLIAVAVHEEVVFRGLLLPYLRRLFGSWWVAGTLSALVFALLHVPHQGLFGGIQVLGIAAVLTVFFVRSRSLLTVIFAHLLFDFLQFQLLRVLPNLQDLLDATRT